MKPHKAARRRKRPNHTPPPPQQSLSRGEKRFLKFLLWLFAPLWLYNGYAYSFNYVHRHPGASAWMTRHGLIFPHIWLGRQLGLIHLPTSEALAQSGNQSPEHIVYLHTDHQNRVIATTDQQGNFVHASLPDSFGKPQNGDPGPTNLGFPGQYYDKETGLYYNNRRDYASARGRYMQPDPIGRAGGTSPYPYAANNPSNFSDPLGLYCTYQQLSGRTVCYPFSPARPPESQNTSEVPGTPRDGLLPYYEETGYSGRGAGRNNPDMQDVENVGPIPRGPWMYTGTPYWSQRTHENTMRLVPLPGNECPPTRDCETFRMHGGKAGHEASKGCIVLPPNRIKIPSNEVIYVQ